MKILVVITGGTISGDFDQEKSTVEAARASSTRFATLIAQRFARLSEDLSVELQVASTPVYEFSEDVIPSDWSVIAESVAGAIRSTTPPSGVVVLHGTDTLSYTAAALSFLLAGVDRPIVVTGSTLPLVAPNSDAPRNLIDAIAVACDPRFQGVFVSFSGDPRRPSDIISGTRSRKRSYPGPASFFSLNAGRIGRVERTSSGSPVVNVECDPGLKHMVALNHRRAFGEVRVIGNGEFVAYFQIFPGFNAGNIRSAAKQFSQNLGTGAIILDLYNSGTACTKRGAMFDLAEAAEYAASVGVPVFATSQHLGSADMNIYPSSRKLLAAGVIPLHSMAHEASIAKLAWVLAAPEARGHGARDYIVEQMTTDLCGELWDEMASAPSANQAPQLSAALG